MALDEEAMVFLSRVIATAYADLYARQRALLAILERHGVIPLERFEDEVERYRRAHDAELVEDGKRWWRERLQRDL